MSVASDEWFECFESISDTPMSDLFGSVGVPRSGGIGCVCLCVCDTKIDWICTLS